MTLTFIYSRGTLQMFQLFQQLIYTLYYNNYNNDYYNNYNNAIIIIIRVSYTILCQGPWNL